MAQLSSVMTQAKEKSKDTLAFINSFIDENSFVETDAFVLSQTALGEAVGEGVVSGFACVNGTQIGVFATNPAVLKGSVGAKAADKIAKCVNAAVKTQSPVVAILDTAGARFAEGMEALEGYGKILAAFAQAYGKVPTVCVLKGSNFGMLSYLTAYCDFTIAFDKAVMATSSPLILASKTKIDVAKVGTAVSHASQSGMVSAVVKTNAELKLALTKYLDLVANTVIDPADDLNRVCKGLKAGVKTATLLNEIADKGSFLEIKAAFAPEVVTGLARLGGITVGIVANNGTVNEGRLSSKGAVKINELLTLCEAYEFPVVNLVDCAGAVNDLQEENDNLIREVGNLIYSYSQVCVGKISLVVGKAIGVGYTALASNALYDYSALWNDAKVGITGDAAAAQLLYSAEIAKAKDKKKAEEKLAKEYAEENMSAETVAASGFFDNIIAPNLSRQFLINAVQMFLSKR